MIWVGSITSPKVTKHSPSPSPTQPKISDQATGRALNGLILFHIINHLHSGSHFAYFTTIFWHNQLFRKRKINYILFSGWINSFLSWEAFEPLARLSYNIYLVHMTIMWYFFGKNTYTASLSDLWMVIGHFILISV